MPAKKPSSERDANPLWDWAKTTETSDVTDVHIETAYRLHLPNCEACKHNCKKNPRCLNALGSAAWLEERADDELMIYDDPMSECRQKDSYVGLQNLGATCYVNSFLQLWFHNAAFRKAVYQWEPESSSPETPNPSSSDPPKFSNSASPNDQGVSNEVTSPPKSVVGQLQLIFASLQFGQRRCVDPIQFVSSLGLATDEQQDAQEFSKLFLSLLETKFREQPNSLVSNVIPMQFSGHCEYITECSACHTVSNRSSTFYEVDLNVKDKKNLHECIEEFLREERLEGQDQYFCQVCNSKVNARRSIKLGKLPPVLNFQLLRYFYDKKTFRKRKVTSPLDFPDVLDMGQYSKNSEDGSIYDLYAVLVHYGSTTDSGHYLAHINDRKSNSWYTFNDGDVTKMDGAQLKLVGEATAKKLKTPKRLLEGHHRSSNVYMLVYRLRETAENNVVPASSDSFEDWYVPPAIQRVIEEDNAKFSLWMEEINSKRAQNLNDGKHKLDEVKKVWEIMPCEDTSASAWRFLPTQWLKKWLENAPTDVPALEFTSELCPHNRLNPESVAELKCVSEEVALLLHGKYGGQSPLGRESLCRDCVVAQGRLIRQKMHIEEDSVFIKKANDSKINVTKTFWVGVNSFNNWEALALANGCYADSARNSAQDSKNGGQRDDTTSPAAKSGISIFNEDIVCSHNNLSPRKSCRRLVPDSVWSRLKSYFPTAREFKESTDTCGDCQLTDALVKKSHDAHRKIAAEQKSSLAELYAGKNRPSLRHVPDVPTTYYAVRKEFVLDWRKFIKTSNHANTDLPIVDIVNERLLCKQHHKLLHMLSDANVADDKIVLLRLHEWNLVKEIFHTDFEISVTLQPPQVPGNEAPTPVFSPDVCLPCIEDLRLELERQQFNYERANIYVMKLSKAQAKKLENLETTPNEFPWTPPDANDVSPQAKRKRVDLPYKVSYVDQIPSGAVVGVRRSSRRQANRNEKMFIVSSSQTLRELKLEIMAVYSAAPFDQHLRLNGIILVDNDMTLGQLKIRPGSVLHLTVDEPRDGAKEVAPEEGFKGTELLRC